MNLGERLRELRHERGATLLQLAQATSLSVSYLSDLERGRVNPSIDTLERIAKHYQVLLGDLVTNVEGWDISADPMLPAGLEHLVHEGALDREAAQDLSRVELRGKRPQTADEWHDLYLYLKSLMRPYLPKDSKESKGFRAETAAETAAETDDRRRGEERG